MQGKRVRNSGPSLISFCLWIAHLICVGQTLEPSALQTSPAPYREDRILVQPKAEFGLAALGNFHATQKVEVLQTFEGIGGLQVIRVPEGETVQGLITKY